MLIMILIAVVVAIVLLEVVALRYKSIPAYAHSAEIALIFFGASVYLTKDVKILYVVGLVVVMLGFANFILTLAATRERISQHKHEIESYRDKISELKDELNLQINTSQKNAMAAESWVRTENELRKTNKSLTKRNVELEGEKLAISRERDKLLRTVRAYEYAESHMKEETLANFRKKKEEGGCHLHSI